MRSSRGSRGSRPRDLVVRSADDPSHLVTAITREIHAVDAALPVSNIARLSDLLDEDVAARRIGTIVIIAFAAFAVLLAVVGLYGMISYFVVQHTSEIGVRIALGAQTRDVVAPVAGNGVALTLVGVGLGAVEAIGATQYVSSLLVEPAGPWSGRSAHGKSTYRRTFHAYCRRFSRARRKESPLAGVMSLPPGRACKTVASNGYAHDLVYASAASREAVYVPVVTCVE